MLNKNIRTQRILLRKYSHADQQEMVKLFMDKTVNRYMGNGPSETEADALELFERIMTLYAKPIERHFEIWAIDVNQQLAGHFELKESQYTQANELEVVYMLHEAYWGRGLMPEILRAINAHAQHLDRQIIATISPKNAQTVRVLEKTGIERQEWVGKGKDKTLKVWIKRGDF